MKTFKLLAQKNYFLGLMLLLLMVLNTGCDERALCDREDIPSSLEVIDEIIGSPESQIKIVLHYTWIVDLSSCSFETCVPTYLTYTLYAKSRIEESEEYIIEGPIRLNPRCCAYKLAKAFETPAFTDFRLVFEGRTSCLDYLNFTNEYTFSTALEVPGYLPSNLVYNPDSIALTSQTPVSSVVPTVDGDGSFIYSLASTGVPSTAISIDANTGVITATYGLFTYGGGNGVWPFGVRVTNTVGTTTFTGAYRVRVDIATGNLPSNLVYNPNSITQTSQVSVSSVVPTVDGDTPLTFSLINSPVPSSAIDIDVNTGVITATDILALEIGNGTYTLDVEVTNAEGSVTFTGAYTVVVAL